MKYRPWPIVILAVLHALSPVYNLISSSRLSGLTVSAYLTTFSSWEETIGFFVLPPVAGFAIFAMKRWSYPVFLLASSWNYYLTYRTWYEVPQHFPLAALIAVFLLNIGVVAYFLLPAVRAAYFKPFVRWWERKPRFRANIRAQLLANARKRKCLVLDLSEGGGRLKGPRTLRKGAKAELRFEFMGKALHLTGRIAHTQRARGTLGIKFEFQDAQQKEYLHRALRVLRVADRRDFPISKQVKNDFVQWAVQLMQSGEGLVPIIRGKDRRKITRNQKDRRKSSRSKKSRRVA